MDEVKSVWDQELYNEIEYTRKESLFHCFEGDTAFVGISFMDELEANHFHEKVQERINKRRSREEAERNSSSQSTAYTGGEQLSERRTKKKENPKKVKRTKSTLSGWRIWKKKEKKDGKPKFDKSMIGGPVKDSFLHVDGVRTGTSDGGTALRFQEDSNESQNNIPESIRQMFTNAGMHDILSNPEKAIAFSDWAEQNGEMEKIMAKKKPAKPPKMPPPQVTSAGILPPPPPPPPPISLTKPSAPPPVPTSPKNFDSGDNSAGLMGQILEVHQLKPAGERRNSFQKEEERDLTELLYSAMKKFEEANFSSDGDSTSDSDDWDD